MMSSAHASRSSSRADDLALGIVDVAKLLERRSAERGESGTQGSSGLGRSLAARSPPCLALHDPHIELVVSQNELVAARPREDPFPPERLAQRAHVALDDLRRRGRMSIRPERGDDAIQREHLVRVQQHQREEHTRAACGGAPAAHSPREPPTGRECGTPSAVTERNTAGT